MKGEGEREKERARVRLRNEDGERDKGWWKEEARGNREGKRQGGCKGRGDLRTRAIMDSPTHVRRVQELARARIQLPIVCECQKAPWPYTLPKPINTEGTLLHINIALFPNTDFFASYLAKIKFSLYQHPIQLLKGRSQSRYFYKTYFGVNIHYMKLWLNWFFQLSSILIFKKKSKREKSN